MLFKNQVAAWPSPAFTLVWSQITRSRALKHGATSRRPTLGHVSWAAGAFLCDLAFGDGSHASKRWSCRRCPGAGIYLPPRH